ncbi:MAG: DEAD/DEAH box helicase family protein [Kiritimatiellae bacterium]|nr:DEAD/DEAH box helicase family protein [Kiritimatiellia bacterium]
MTMASSPEEKIRLFRAMFRGRDDVYARRYVSTKSGKCGYSPVCAVEWTRGICDKKRVACAVCPNRQFVPLDDEAVRQHLCGGDARVRDFTLGCYPLLPDDTVRFAAIDLDKASWRSDSSSICDVLRELELPVARERSRSGNGAHLWFFFEEPQPARFVRDVLTYVLTLTMERNPEVGLGSYDRIFPNQDRLPKGGFGNLIALPLQGASRRAGNTCFVDERLVPFPDQWKFLSELPLITGEQLSKIRARAFSECRSLMPQTEENALRNEPWTLFNPHSNTTAQKGCELPVEQVSGKIQITLGNAVYIRQTELTPALRGRLIRLAAFVNPEYANMQRLRLSVYNTPRVIDRSVNGDDFLILPRGCLDGALETIRNENAEYEIFDKRVSGEPLGRISFVGELRDEQRLAAQELVRHDTGVLAAGTAFGKTVLAAWMIAERKVPTLVLVNRRQLQSQWVERLSQFLDIPKKDIGRMGGGANKLNGRLDVALMQTLTRMDDAFLVSAIKGYGQIVVDECHAISAPSFERVAHASSARYFIGLSATVVRQDGQHPIIEMECGPVRYRVDAKKMDAFAAFRHVVRVRPTPFVPKTESLDKEGAAKFADVVAELADNETRNAMIAADVAACVREGRSPVVISERRGHLDALAELLDGAADHILILRGGIGRRAFKSIREELDAIPPGESRILLATGSYLGEGFDDARLDTLFLTLPISWRGRIVQYAGRLHRQCDRKREVRIYDYLDQRVALCAKMFNRRAEGYRDIGYEMVMTDDSLGGWPKGVEIPVELRDDESYADSIRRLGRDGVDAETADLFVHAALEKAGEGDSARSAAERFLFKFLGGLPQTMGLFTLNGRIDVPFGPNPFMEVDLLCESKHLAVEIDGAFHFTDAEHYRRDRRKDFLLQKNGYLVLRFLAEDVTRRLAQVIDEIAAAIESISISNP